MNLKENPFKKIKNESKTIVIASNNKYKIQEFKEMLPEYNILTLNDIEYYEDIEETGETFVENAIIKAKTIHEYLKNKNLDYIVVADDSGLCVDSLNGAPGVYSARYAGDDGDSKANRNKLLKELAENNNRDAYFICTIAMYYPNGEYKISEGKTYGKITEKELGEKEFGYDRIFYSNDLGKTFAQATEEEKNSISHRAKAIKEMLKNM